MNAPPAEPAHRFTALDSLRGIAALGVAVHHIQATSGPATWPLFAHGQLFVDFFFVLSGFVIAASYGERLAKGFPLRRFAVLRVGRVWPLHAFMVLLGLALEVLSLAIRPRGLSASAPFTGLNDPLHAFTALFLLDGMIPGWSNYYSRAGWTISVELLLYALAALAFRRGRSGLIAFAVLAIAALAAMFAGCDAPLATNAVQRGLTGFALGTACWFVHRRFEGEGLPMATLAEAAALLALLTVIAFPPGPFPTLPVIAASALVVLVFAQQQGTISRVLCRNPWVWLGQVSYALYMVHAMVKGRAIDIAILASQSFQMPIAQWSIDGDTPVKQLTLAPLPSTLLQLVIVALMLLAAHFAHRWIEEPARQWSRRLAGRL